MHKYNLYPLIYNLLKYHVKITLSNSVGLGSFLSMIHQHIIVYFQISQNDTYTILNKFYMTILNKASL